MHLPFRAPLGLALLLSACGNSSSPNAAAVRTDASSSEEASADDAETRDGPVDSGAADSSADVVQDSPAAESGAVDDASADAGHCTPVKFPLPSPCGGSTITGPGSVYLYQPQAMPPMCFVYALSEAGTACESCAETFTCACIDPDGGLTGVTCLNAPSGPYLSQN